MSKTVYTQRQSANIPPELRAMDQWANWHGDKVIRNCHTSANGSSTNPNTWGSFAQALRRDPDHLVFVFARNGGLAGIDLDHCRNPETGEIESWAQDVVDRFPHVYWEVSLSGTGLHGIGYGALPTEKSGWHPDRIGIFHHSRYFVVTGDALPGHETLGDFGDDLADWCHETFPPDKPIGTAPPAALTLDDHDLLDRLRRRSNGKAASLLDGHTAGYASISEARFALANMALFYTDDPDQVGRILRAAPLWNAKDRDHNRDRKAAHDARQAIASYTGERYTPNRPPDPPPTFADRNRTGTGEGDTCSAQLAEARREIASLKRDRNALIALVLNPHVSSAEKMAVAATIDRAIRNPVDDDGLVTIKPGEIANDWRQKPERGQNTAPLNRDGSKPRMNRTSVRKTMLALTRRGLKAEKATEKITPKNGRKPYDETVWRVRPPANMAEFLAPIAMYQPATIAPRKARTINPQCPTCHIDLQDVTTWTVTEGTCPECGELHRDESPPRTVHPVVTIDPQHSEDNLSPVRSVATTGDKLSSEAPPFDDEPPDYWVPPTDRASYPQQPSMGRSA